MAFCIISEKKYSNCNSIKIFRNFHIQLVCLNGFVFKNYPLYVTIKLPLMSAKIIWAFVQLLPNIFFWLFYSISFCNFHITSVGICKTNSRKFTLQIGFQAKVRPTLEISGWFQFNTPIVSFKMKMSLTQWTISSFSKVQTVPSGKFQVTWVSSTHIPSIYIL